MLIKTFPAGPLSTNAYVLIDGAKALIIDPAPGSAPVILEAVQGLHVEAIFLTHSHWDHIGDVAELKEKLNIPVYVHPKDSPNLEKPGCDGIPLMFPITGVVPDFFLENGQKLNFNIEVIDTPGHTPGGVCFYISDEHILFSGDTLFAGSIGNLSFPTADPEAMWKSLEKLAKLPKSTRVYPGHGPSTTIGEETWLGNAKQIFS